MGVKLTANIGEVFLCRRDGTRWKVRQVWRTDRRVSVESLDEKDPVRLSMKLDELHHRYELQEVTDRVSGLTEYLIGENDDPGGTTLDAVNATQPWDGVRAHTEGCAAPVDEVVDGAVVTDPPASDSVELIPLPRSGEILDLDGSDEHLAAAFDELREYEGEIKLIRYAVADVLRERMDARASWTTRAGGFKVTAPSPAPSTEYDGDALAPILVGLVKAEKITQDAADAALEVQTVNKPKPAGINRLLKLGGEVKTLIETCKREKPRENRPVSVKFERTQVAA